MASIEQQHCPPTRKVLGNGHLTASHAGSSDRRETFTVV
jgi:hypothetical protein